MAHVAPSGRRSLDAAVGRHYNRAHSKPAKTAKAMRKTPEPETDGPERGTRGCKVLPQPAGPDPFRAAPRNAPDAAA